MGKGAALDWWLLWLGVMALVLVGLLQGAGDILGELGLNLWTWGQTTFRPWSTTLQALALPALVWLAFTYLLKEVFPRPQPVSRAVVSVVTAFWGVRYLLWRLVATLNLENPVAATVSLALFGAEALTLLNAVLFYLHHIFQVNRSREADRWSRAVLEGTYLPWVDVLIPTYNEDVTILRRTVIGCQAMDYPHKRVYLLDDGRRPEVKKLAQALGCGYRDRPDNRHAKAGNINHALPTLHGELVAIFDADFVPTQNFLQRTVGFFQDPRTALVQTPQNFFNEDPVSVNLGLEGIVNNEQTLFFRYIQPSRDFWDAVVCCGTCFVVRRSALEEIGGIPTGSITEDYFLSLQLQRRGYRVKYLNEALAAGLAPETIGAFVDQRLRWGQGTLQLLFLGANVLTMPGLSWGQRFSHALGFLYWFLSLCRLVFLTAPLVYLLLDIAPLRATVDELIFFYLPYYISGVMCFSWLTENRRSAFWSDVYETLLCWPMALTVVRTLLNPYNKPFKVTPKGVDTRSIHCHWPLMHPLLVLLGLSVLGVGRQVWLQGAVVRNPDSLAINLLWAAYNGILLAVCLLAAIDVHRSPYPWFARQVPCELKLRGWRWPGATVALSEAGALVVLLGQGVRQPGRGYLVFRQGSPLGHLELPVQVHPEGPVLQVTFLDMDLPTLRRLIPYLYCQPNQWPEVKVPEWQTLWAMITSLWRLYPLAAK